jgi:hypothetical protein
LARVVADEQSIENSISGLRVKTGGIDLGHLSFSPALEGHQHKHEDPFSKAGWKVSDAGTIWQGDTYIFADGQIALGSGTGTIKLSSNDPNYRIWGGAVVPEVNEDGVFLGKFALKADGSIIARLGEIAGWTIATDYLEADSGSAKIQAGANPYIALGAATDYLTGTGFWVGKHSGSYKLHLGDPTGIHLKWDASALTVDQPVVLDGDIQMYYDAGRTIKTIHLETDGDASFGSDLSAVATTVLKIFSNAQSWDSEAFGAGDIHFGNHGAANMLWDASAGQLQFRNASTVHVYIDTDGTLRAGGGSTILDNTGLNLVYDKDLAPASGGQIKFWEIDDQNVNGVIFTHVLSNNIQFPYMDIYAGVWTGTPSTSSLSTYTHVRAFAQDRPQTGSHQTGLVIYSDPRTTGVGYMLDFHDTDFGSVFKINVNRTTLETWTEFLTGKTNHYYQLEIKAITAPGAPGGAGWGNLYMKTGDDGLFWHPNGGSEVDLTAAGGGGAPVGESYVVMALSGTLTAERRLQGTANQITLTDGGANGDATLSLPSTIQWTGAVTLQNLTSGDFNLTPVSTLAINPPGGASTSYGVDTAPVANITTNNGGWLHQSATWAPTSGSSANYYRMNYWQYTINVAGGTPQYIIHQIDVTETSAPGTNDYIEYFKVGSNPVYTLRPNGNAYFRGNVTIASVGDGSGLHVDRIERDDGDITMYASGGDIIFSSSRLYFTGSAQPKIWSASYDITISSGTRKTVIEHASKNTVTLEIGNEENVAGQITGEIDFRGWDSLNAEQVYASIKGVVVDPLSTSVDGRLEIWTWINNTETEIIRIEDDIAFYYPTIHDTRQQIKGVAAPGAGPTGYGNLYAKTDGKLYFHYFGGSEVDLTAGGAVSLWTDNTTWIVPADTTDAVTIGANTAPDGVFHVFEGSAGVVSADASADTAVLESSGDGGFSILVPDANWAGVYFGSPSANKAAWLSYNYSSSIFAFEGPDGGTMKFNSLLDDVDYVWGGDIIDDLLYLNAGMEVVVIGGQATKKDEYRLGLQSKTDVGWVDTNDMVGIIQGDVEGSGVVSNWTFLDYQASSWQAYFNVLSTNLLFNPDTGAWSQTLATHYSLYYNQTSRTIATASTDSGHGFLYSDPGDAVLHSIVYFGPLGVIINEDGIAAHDVRIETDNMSDFLKIDGGADFMGIGTATQQGAHIFNVNDPTSHGGANITSWSGIALGSPTNGAVASFMALDYNSGANLFIDWTLNLEYNPVTPAWNQLNSARYSYGIEQSSSATNAYARFWYTTTSSTTAQYIAYFGSDGIVFNEAGVDINYRIETNSLDDAFFIDGGTDFTGFGLQAAPNSNVWAIGRELANLDLGFYAWNAAPIVGFNAYVSGGTEASPSATPSGSGVYFSSRGWATGGYTLTRAYVGMIATQAYTASAQGTRIDIAATPDGSTTRAVVGKWQLGLQVGAPTGGDKGVGTINVATDAYKNNSAYVNPDYVLEHYYHGIIDKFADNEGASDYAGLLSIQDTADYMEANLHLPWIGRESSGIFDRGDMALVGQETLMLHIIELEARIRDLEAQIH